MRERIAEGERAAENRVQAAEEEANEIGRLAREEAEHAKTVATTEAQEILAKAYEDANRTREEGEDAKAASNSEALTILARAQEQAEANLAKAQAQSRELLGQARIATADVHSEGLELVQNLRELGDSLRSNAERLLRDVQAIHSRMVAGLDRVDDGASRITTPGESERESGTGRRGRGVVLEGPTDVDGLDIPEFIPPE
jgi:vacuolar-type H+-ATPase subunit H